MTEKIVMGWVIYQIFVHGLIYYKIDKNTCNVFIPISYTLYQTLNFICLVLSAIKKYSLKINFDFDFSEGHGHELETCYYIKYS